MAEIERWITVRGNHIPIYEGESKMSAIGRFIKGKSKDKLKSRFGEKMIDKYEYTADPYYEGEKYSEEHMREKYGKNWNKYNKHDIKGYSDDPNNLRGKVQAAREKIYNNWDAKIKEANAYDNDLFSGERYKAYVKEGNDIWKKYPSENENIKTYYKREAELGLSRTQHQKDRINARRESDMAEVRRDEAIAIATNRIANQDYRYKIKSKDLDSQISVVRTLGLTPPSKGYTSRAMNGISVKDLYKQQKGIDIVETALNSSKVEKYAKYVAQNHESSFGIRKNSYWTKRGNSDAYAKRNNLNADSLYYMTKISSGFDKNRLMKVAFRKYKQEHPNTKMDFIHYKEMLYNNK